MTRLELESQPISAAQARSAEARLRGGELETFKAQNIGEAPKPSLVVEVIGPIEANDLKTMFLGEGAKPLAPRAGVPTIADLKASHHRVAQLIAQGLPRPTVALRSGYSTGHIAHLEKNPAFRALVEHYMDVVELEFVDVIERMRDVGIEALDRLKAQLVDDERDFSVRELNEIIGTNLVQPMMAQAKAAAGAGAGGNAPVPSIHISFPGVEAKPRPLVEVKVEEGK